MTSATKKDANNSTDTKRGTVTNEAAICERGIQGKILLVNKLGEQWKHRHKQAIKLLNGGVGCEKKSIRKKVRSSLYGKEIKEMLL